MFRNVVGDNPLVNRTTDGFFKHIRGDGYRGDYSFLATLRALVSSRMANTDKISLKFGSSSYSSETVSSTPTGRMVASICSGMPSGRGVIYIHSLKHKQEDNYANLELLKSSFCSKYPGWQIIEKITDFYRKQFYVLCFVNPDTQSVAVFVDNMDVRKMHYLQCSIFAFLPWYFSPEKGVTELEMRLIESLREKTPNKYIEVLEEIAKQFDFRTETIKRLLKGFETKYEQLEVSAVQRKIMDTSRRMEDIYSQLEGYLKSKRDLEIKLLGLETKIASGSEESEIMDYFLCNKKLTLYNVSEATVRFAVKDYLTYFDEEMAASMISNKMSYIYCPGGEDMSHIIPKNQMEKLMKAIFIDQVFKIKFCAAYEFSLTGHVEGLDGFDFGSEFNDSMPNIHIQAHRCLGNYRTEINKLLDVRDYIGAIEQCVASCKSLNFGDSTVMKTFIKVLYGTTSRYNNKCIELPDGSIVMPKDAIAWLEKQEGSSDE